MTDPSTMNAKERRKLLRRQQRGQDDSTPAAAAVVVNKEPAVVKTEVKPDAEEDKTMNAKERRKLMREQQRKQEEAVVKTEPSATSPTSVAAPVAAAAAPGERLNAKQRRLLQRQATRGDSAPTKPQEAQQIGKKRKRKAKSSAEEGEDGDEENAKKKRIHLTLFVGQLPFKCTEAMIRKHFAEAGEITLRMLTDKKTKKFKGTAFIEVKDSKALGAALSRHHTLLNGRRINVELTASGGGNNSTQRREKIDSLRKKQSEKQLEKTRALVQKYIDAPDSKLKADDVDERMIDFLSWFDYGTAKEALEAYTTSVSSRVKNTKAFFMGILKRFRTTDGEE